MPFVVRFSVTPSSSVMIRITDTNDVMLASGVRPASP
jgi:hypothetical protein